MHNALQIIVSGLSFFVGKWATKTGCVCINRGYEKCPDNHDKFGTDSIVNEQPGVSLLQELVLLSK